ncbi:tRNA-processing ribonuclease [Brevibacterium sp. 5221]|uniref:tRNA-processing ribonuclease n=1 Tax=Brevibacterium rongguiense TaxID=2695267 RepID=A0A6N9H916_9MICO|nr:YhjD/YihY/BrkB family envelope integrity protein [Brevibacterium rongguiense]MYM20513.1 tRNA-processing ribonuclease [Brevibacterium rongguiense]
MSETAATDKTALLTRRRPGGAATVLRKPVVVHLRHTIARFGQRMGNQFAAAITYFLVLALIPTLMFAFATLGFVLSVVRPELVDVVIGEVRQLAPGQDQLVEMLQNYLKNWAGVGIVAVVGALYTAQGFIGNFKDAVRFQLAADMDDVPKEPFAARIGNNVVTLVGLLVGIAVTIAATAVGTGLQTTIAQALDLPGWFAPLLNIGTIAITLLMAWLVFLFIFTLIPSEPIPPRTKRIGSFAGALALTVLLNIATVLVDAFSSSPTAALFGPVIAIMLSMNIFTRIVLLVAAWMGTSNDRPVFRRLSANSAPPAEQGEKSVGPAAGESFGALAAAAGIIALTLLGLKRYEDTHERSLFGR